MVDLDNLEEIKKLDPKNVLGSLEMFLGQCHQIWDEAKKVAYPNEFKDFKNILICGMGGSAYGGYVTSALFKNELRIPLLTQNDYHLPEFVNKDSLVILSTYSGGTEEPLNCAQEAVNNGFPIVGLTSGGKAQEMYKQYNFPTLLFDPKYNPSGQPRLGMGYMVLGIIAILNRLGLISVSDDQLNQAISDVKKNQEDIKGKAKELANGIYGSIPVIFSAEFLAGNAHILRNQFNETSKSFSAFSELPELNHHLMEGLKNPTGKKLIALFITSDFYSDNLKRGNELTKDVVSKNGIEYIEYRAQGSTKLSQMLNVLSFGGYLTFYLAMLYGQDPSLIPWVDYFKKQLEKKI